MLIGSYGLSSRFVAALDAGGDPIVSRGAFPKRVEAAVRQKARWTTGISLEGWDHLGWLRPPGTGARTWVAWWMLWRDRRAPARSEEGRGGKGGVRTCRIRGGP